MNFAPILPQVVNRCQELFAAEVHLDQLPGLAVGLPKLRAVAPQGAISRALGTPFDRVRDICSKSTKPGENSRKFWTFEANSS